VQWSPTQQRTNEAEIEEGQSQLNTCCLDYCRAHVYIDEELATQHPLTNSISTELEQTKTF
jgi:hypothetical protein